MLSLIHILAARACHADTLKRALDNTANEESDSARRLLARLGIGPTHLEDMRRGSAERLRAATSATLADYLLLSARLMAGGLDGTEAAMLRGQMEAPWRALTPKEHEAVRVVAALYDRLAKLQAERGDIRTQAAFEHQPAEADEHVRVTEKRLLHAAEFENEVLTLLGVEYRSEALDAIRALHGRLAAAEAASEHGPIADLLALGGERVEVSQEDGKYHAQVRLSEAAANDGDDWLCASGGTAREALLNLREKVKATLPTTPGPREDEAVLGPWTHDPASGDVGLWLRPFADCNRGAVVVGPVSGWTVYGTVGQLRHHGNECGEAGKVAADLWLRANGYTLRDVVKPPEPIVLGPWESVSGPGWSRWSRQIVGTDIDGIAMGQGGWAVYDRAGSCVCHGEETGQAGRDAADKWARENGYVLIGAEPGSITGTIRGVMVPHHRHGRLVFRWEATGSAKVGLTEQGWWIHAAPDGLPNSHRRSVAEGPQTGEEGKRYALAAAHALGLTGGGE